MAEIKEERYLKNYPIPIPIERTEEILYQMKNSVCKIYKGGFIGTGFFCKKKLLNNNKKDLYVLITNNHVLNEDKITLGSTISLSIWDNDNQIQNITISLNRKKYTNEDLDTTIIEIYPEKDNIPKTNFLEIDLNADQDEQSLKNIYENKSIYLLGYPEGGKVKVSYGILKELNKDRINHLCSTEEGSSGSPIILSENSKLIGVHFGTPQSINFQYNIGTFIKYPFLNFINNEENDEDKILSNSNIEDKETDISFFNNINEINFTKDKMININLASIEGINSINVDFILNLDINEKIKTIVELSGILKICLLKYIAKLIDNNGINRIQSKEIKKIILDLKKEMDVNKLTNDSQKNININMSKNMGRNIITYINYINHIWINYHNMNILIKNSKEISHKQ